MPLQYIGGLAALGAQGKHWRQVRPGVVVIPVLTGADGASAPGATTARSPDDKSAQPLWRQPK